MNRFGKMIYGFRQRVSAAVAPGNAGETFFDGYSIGSNPSGIYVTEKTAMQASAVFASVRILSESVAGLPCIFYERSEGGKERSVDHPLFNILRYEPNPEMSAFRFFEALMGHLLLWGNSYAEIQYNGKGEIVALWPLRPDRVQPERNKTTKNIEYIVRLKNGEPITLPAASVLHIPFYSFDGIVGVSPIGYARLSVGLSIATERYGASFFGNGARPGGVLQHPETLSEEAYIRLKKNWNSEHQGLSNAQRLAILEEGLTYQQIGVPPEDAQFLETRRFQVEEIARIYRIPPHMLADLEKATFSNIEQQSLEFVIHTVRPWLVRWEQEIHRALLLPRERKDFFAEFLVDGLLRGDIASRYQAYATARQNGWLSANDIRRLENMNAVDGGDIYLVPLNMIPANDLISGNAERSDGADVETRLLGSGEGRSDQRKAAARRRAMLSWRKVFTDAGIRIIKKEAADLRKIVKDTLDDSRSETDLQNELDTYYQDRFTKFSYDRFMPVASGYSEEIANLGAQEAGYDGFEDVVEESFLENYTKRYVKAFISRHAADSRSRVDKAIKRAGEKSIPVFEEVNSEIDGWEETRPAEIGQAESVRQNGAVVTKIFELAGVLKMVWIAYGDSCPYCKSLNGRVVGINQMFLNAGEAFGGDSEAGITPLTVQQSKRHPPAHGGCDCMVGAYI